jgi:CHAT domain-containing protein
MLSACESNLTGEDTEDLLTPVGIGPTLAAAGTKTVVGTLWTYNDVAALCFNYHFHQIANAKPDLPWHQVATQARKALQKMTNGDLKKLIDDLKLETENACRLRIKKRMNFALQESKRPFEDLSRWGGFIVLGQVKR